MAVTGVTRYILGGCVVRRNAVDAWCLKEWGARCFARQSQKFVSIGQRHSAPTLTTTGTDAHFPEPTALRIQGRLDPIQRRCSEVYRDRTHAL